MFATQTQYQMSLRLATKAWMLWCETGSTAARRAHARRMGVVSKLQQPSGENRGGLWVDHMSDREWEKVLQIWDRA